MLQRGGDLLQVHLERAVARDTHHIGVGSCEPRADRARHAEAHHRLLGGGHAAAVLRHLHERAVVRPEILSAVLVDEHEAVREDAVERVHHLLRP